MKNQHRKIKGYKELNQEQINAMNRVKELGVLIEQEIKKLELLGKNTDLLPSENAPIVDYKWLNAGTLQLQQGLMLLTRSIAQPDFF